MSQAKTYFDVGTYSASSFKRLGIPTKRTYVDAQTSKSLRFRASNSAYLSRTPSASNRKTWTWSGWVKRGILGVDSQSLFEAYVSASSYLYIQFRYAATPGYDTLEVCDAVGAVVATTQVFRDPSAFYHIVVVWDTTQVTSTDRIKIYVNGVQSTALNRNTFPTLNYDGIVNSATAHNIGKWSYTPSYFDGYIAEAYFIDGQALTPSSFGQTNSDGIWVTKAYTGTYGTNGFYLNFSDNSAATAAAIGKDSSGNGNNWTPSGISITAGVTNDSLTDSPTDYGTDTGAGGEVRGNYCTLNPLLNISGSDIVTKSDGNLTFSHSGSAGYANRMTVAGIVGMTSGKFKAEYIVGATVNDEIGIGSDFTNTNYYGTYGYQYDSSGGAYQHSSGSTPSAPASLATGDIVTIELDADNLTVQFWKNGVSQGTITGIESGKTWFFMRGVRGSSTAGGGSWNFGQRPWAYVTTSGFKALCTTNIIAPADASNWFYGSTPDFLWIKNRTTAASHSLTDTVRGIGTSLSSDTTSAEYGTDIYDMNKFGVTLIGASSRVTGLAGTTDNFVYWAWKAGGAGVNNTAGSITSQVSANPTAGISVVTYTGIGGAATVGHGLGIVPAMAILKSRSSVDNWYVQHKGLTAASNLQGLNTTAAQAAISGQVGGGLTTLASSTTLSLIVGSSHANNVNNSGSTYDVICFAEISGFSKFGSYTGNASADGPFVWCGFRPKFLMVKNTANGALNWLMWDSARTPYNLMDNALYPNLSSAEASGWSIDFLSNGFKVRDSEITVNESGSTHIFAAFAESPFKTARAR